MAESLDGLGVIQAYNKQQYFTTVTSQHVDAAHRALFGAETLNLWLAFICDFFGGCPPRVPLCPSASAAAWCVACICRRAGAAVRARPGSLGVLLLC